ncbi:MAG: ABC transporter ATP-binding protein [Chloroflexi bacterium]|nr:ABC transporter ATP-binding protein [Chloroflexota bacterium]
MKLDQRPLLEIHNIYVGYAPEDDVIRGVSLDLSPGHIASVLGHHGSGKSTILKALFGVHPIRDGRVLYNDREITHIKPQSALKVGIAYVAQDRNIFPYMTVYENLEVGLYWHHNRRAVRSHIERTLSYFPTLTVHLKSRARTLTGAEQRLLEIARALLWEPRLLLIDEPSLNLQADMRQKVFHTIQRLNQETGLSVLMTEQNTHLGISICHRGYLLHNGRIIYEGTRDELTNNRSVIRTVLGE